MEEKTAELFHLTLTGYYAGRTLCGIDREDARAKGHTFSHAAYTSDERVDSPACCPRCREVWRDDSEDEGE